MKKSCKFAAAALLPLTMMLLLATFDAQPALSHPSSFYDVSESNPAHQAIEALAAEGAVSGGADGGFQPDSDITRAEAARTLAVWRGLTPNRPAGAVPSFSDLDSTTGGYVEAAYAAHWMSGYPDGTFRPGAPMTREQMAVAVVRSLGLDSVAMGLTAYQIDEALKGFADEMAVSSDARAYLALALRKGLVAGDDGRLHPLDVVTRAQFCLVLGRADALSPWALASFFTPEEQALAGWIDKDLLMPHHSPITGTMVLQTAARYGIPPLAQLVILAAETSLGDPRLGGALARNNNFGCLRYHGAATPWGLLSSGRVWVAGKDWYSFATPADGMAAFGRYLKAAVNGFYVNVLGGEQPDWGLFAAVYYGRSVSGYSAYVGRLYFLERAFRAQAKEQGLDI